MNDILKWVGKFLLHAVFWVFVLSIRWEGRTLFTYAHETLVQNDLVQAIDQELGDVWYRLRQTARVTFSDTNKDDEQSM